jgi:ABC-type amino acid transport substrate-binding protein
LQDQAKVWDVDIHFHTHEIYEDIWDTPKVEGFDVAAGGITPQPDRKEQTIYSIPTAFYSQSLLVRKNDYSSGTITGYESFKGEDFKIGVLNESAGEKFGCLRAQEYGLDLSIFKQYKGEADLLPALIKGDIAAIARGDIGNDYQTSKDSQLITLARKNYNERIFFAVDRRRQTFLQELNKAIIKVTHEGKLSYSDWLRNNQIFNY